jgi:hypothetical protein
MRPGAGPELIAPRASATEGGVAPPPPSASHLAHVFGCSSPRARDSPPWDLQLRVRVRHRLHLCHFLCVARAAYCRLTLSEPRSQTRSGATGLPRWCQLGFVHMPAHRALECANLLVFCFERAFSFVCLRG